MNIWAYIPTLTDHEIAAWSLAATIIFGVVAVIAVVVAIRAKYDSKAQLDLARKVASAERVFDAPDLQCNPFGRDCPNDIIIGTNLTEGHINELQLPLVIQNIGRKVAEDVTLYVRLPKELSYNNAISRVEGGGPATTIRNAKIAFMPTENFATFVASIPKVQTYDVIPIAIPLSVARDTELSGSTTVKLKDDVSATIPYKVFYAYIMTVFIACDGASPISRAYSIQIIDTAGSTLKDAIDLRSTYLRRNATESKARKPWFARLLAAIKYARESKTKLKTFWAVIISDEDKHRNGDGIIDRFKTEHMKVYEGRIDGRDGTMFVPGIGTTLFGQETRPRKV